MKPDSFHSLSDSPNKAFLLAFVAWFICVLGKIYVLGFEMVAVYYMKHTRTGCSD